MRISIVSPVFNEENVVGLFIDELLQTCFALDLDFEIILVDDGSKDNTWNIISKMAEVTPNLKAVRLVRNYGKDTAMYTGLEQIDDSDIVIILDSDLQHPPKVIRDLLRVINDGNEIVYAVKSARPSESLFSYLSATVFYAILALIHKDITPLKTDFIAFTNFTRISILGRENRELPLKVAMLTLNPKSSSIEFTPRNRPTGRSSWTFSKKFRLGLKLLFSNSAKPTPILFSVFLVSILLCTILAPIVFLQIIQENTSLSQTTLLFPQTVFFSILLIIALPSFIHIFWSFKSKYFKTRVEVREIRASEIE